MYYDLTPNRTLPWCPSHHAGEGASLPPRVLHITLGKVHHYLHVSFTSRWGRCITTSTCPSHHAGEAIIMLVVKYGHFSNVVADNISKTRRIRITRDHCVSLPIHFDSIDFCVVMNSILWNLSMPRVTRLAHYYAFSVNKPNKHRYIFFILVQRTPFI